MDKIIPSLKKSIFESSKNSLINLGELGIDSILDEGLLRDLPIVTLLIGTKNTVQNIHDRNLLRQTLKFIQELNSGKINEKKLAKYKEKINNDNRKAEKELGRVLIILNRNIEIEKSKMLANLYRNYINEVINWNEFCEFSEIINMLLINDINYLEKIYTSEIKDTKSYHLYPFERLESLGLIETTPKGLFSIDPNGSYVRIDKFVLLSDIGKKFYQTINR